MTWEHPGLDATNPVKELERFLKCIKFKYIAKIYMETNISIASNWGYSRFSWWQLDFITHY